MNEQLIVCRSERRDRFYLERFLGSDPILAVVKEGCFTMEREGQRFTVKANEAALFRKNILYDRRVITPVELYLFRFRDGGETVFAEDHIIFKDLERLHSTLHMLDQLDRGIYKNDQELRGHLFRDLLAQYILENEIPPVVDSCIEEALQRIRRHLHDEIDLNAIGTKSGLSYVQFLRRFKAATGMSPSDYVTALRLQKAKELLSDTPMLVKEIADACGFANEYYFSNFFKKQTGLSPSAFRAALS